MAARRHFDSRNKFSSALTIHRDPRTGQVTGGSVFTKGAPEVVLERCTATRAAATGLSPPPSPRPSPRPSPGSSPAPEGSAASLSSRSSPGRSVRFAAGSHSGAGVGPSPPGSPKAPGQPFGPPLLAPLDAAGRLEVVERVVGPYADAALRTLALASRTLSAAEATLLLQTRGAAPTPGGQSSSPARAAGRGGGGGGGGEATLELSAADWDRLDAGLTLEAVVGIQDPLRPNAERAVATCQAAGIAVRMVTGDNLATAVAIARSAGILPRARACAAAPAAPEVMTGPYFRTTYADLIARATAAAAAGGEGGGAAVDVPARARRELQVSPSWPQPPPLSFSPVLLPCSSPLFFSPALFQRCTEAEAPCRCPPSSFRTSLLLGYFSFFSSRSTIGASLCRPSGCWRARAPATSMAWCASCAPLATWWASLETASTMHPPSR